MRRAKAKNLTLSLASTKAADPPAAATANDSDALNTSVSKHLPSEILAMIIGYIAPSDPREIIPASHESTKTLLKLAQTCKLFHHITMRHVLRHCVYIDSRSRIQSFVEYVTVSLSHPRNDGRLQHIHQMYMRPFQSDSGSERNIYEEESGASTVLDSWTCSALVQVFKRLAGGLRRLVVDIPLRSLSTTDGTGETRILLHQGFKALDKLEEFTSINDELYLKIPNRPYTDSQQPPESLECVWRHWPALRRLCLYNLDLPCGGPIWDHLRNHPKLEHLLLVRGEPSIVEDETDIKEAWKCAKAPESDEEAGRQLSVTWWDSIEEQPNFTKFAADWAEIDPKQRVRVMVVDTPNAMDPIDMNKDVVRHYVLKGTLFELDAIGAEDGVTKNHNEDAEVREAKAKARLEEEGVLDKIQKYIVIENVAEYARARLGAQQSTMGFDD